MLGREGTIHLGSYKQKSSLSFVVLNRPEDGLFIMSVLSGGCTDITRKE